jgi:hypothetical protein
MNKQNTFNTSYSSDIPPRKKLHAQNFNRKIFIMTKNPWLKPKSTLKPSQALKPNKSSVSLNLISPSKSFSFELFPRTNFTLVKKPSIYDTNISTKLIESTEKLKKHVADNFQDKIFESICYAEGETNDLNKIRLKTSFSHPKSSEIFKFVKEGNLLEVRNLLEEYSELKEATDSVM